MNQFTKEAKIFHEKVNYDLLSCIASSVYANSSKADTEELRKFPAFAYNSMMFSLSTKDNLSDKYGFNYIGELLERYEERHGMNKADFRAIALALGYTQAFQESTMFVGNQKEVFVRKVEQEAQDDIFLCGALYLIGGAQNNDLKHRMIGMCDNAENLIFTLSVLGEDAGIPDDLRQPVIHLLGERKPVPVLGNASVYNWLFRWLRSCGTTLRNKEFAPLRALRDLPKSFAKPGSKCHTVLSAHGYSDLEIFYASAMAVETRATPEVPLSNSITAVKIVVALFEEFLNCETAADENVYEQMALLYNKYKKLPVRCGGNERLEEAVFEARINNAKTFTWMAGLLNSRYFREPIFDNFDIADSRWDILASSLNDERYNYLFHASLSDSMSKADIMQRLERYKQLKGKDFQDIALETGYCLRLLCEKGIINLWDAFFNLDEQDKHDRKILENIMNYVQDVQTRQSFCFVKKLYDEYGPNKLAKYNLFALDLNRCYYSAHTPESNFLKRDFLGDDEQRQLVIMYLDYVFLVYPNNYLKSLALLIASKKTSEVIPFEARQKLYAILSKNSDFSFLKNSEMKSLYMTEAQIEEERKAKEKAQMEAEQKQYESIQAQFREATLQPNPFTELYWLLRRGSYSLYGERLVVACQVVRQLLDTVLEEQSYALDKQELTSFLSVCSVLYQHNGLSWEDFLTITSKIKERELND